MKVTQEVLAKLADKMPYKYRLQSAKYGKASIVSYIDNRQLQDKLDSVVGPANWRNEFQVIDGNLFAGISIKVWTDGEEGSIENGYYEWITKWDVGTEGNIEKEKSSASDAQKRAGVQWGIGRFLYSLGIITLKAVEHTNKKEYPATKTGQILWSPDALHDYCSKLAEQGITDDTRPAPAPKKASPAKVATPVEKKAEVAPVVQPKENDDSAKEVAKPTPTTTPPSNTKAGESAGGSAIQPSKEFDDNSDADRIAKAKLVFAKLPQAEILGFLITKKNMKYVSVSDFVDAEPIDDVLKIYQEFSAQRKKK